MGSIGDVSTTTGSDVLGFRCPVGEAKVFEVSDVAGFTAGTFALRSDAVIFPMQTVTSGIIVAAYEVPKLQVKALPAGAMYAGQNLSLRLSTNEFEDRGSDVAAVAVALEGKAAGVSELMVHFNGYGFGNDSAGSDALAIA
ncbi:hypothetical protein KAR91_20750 [Candidatus Pacearchaeota archaeon]|nr:hypothetical protein [Candidatus Pacearchaeota archaeon]